ncbi:MAG TPA: diaminopimelate decarboxylase [bacterium]|nr:diaminopimelate decarboxylase [bacterium]
MSGFNFRNNRWYSDSVALDKIADKVGTPCYVYSLPAFEEKYREVDHAYRSIPHLVAYSIKTNDNLSVIHALGKLGSGTDVVSGGELYKARKAGIPADKIIYAGVAKTDDEIAFALKENIRYFNVESIPEISAINAVAKKLRKIAPIAVRFNPNIDALTHHFISTGKKENKFGVFLGDLDEVMRTVRGSTSVRWTGVHAHIGSQMTQTGSLGRSARVVEQIVLKLRHEGFPIYDVNLGGGYGIDYNGEKPPKASQYASVVLPVIKRLNAGLILELGRFISGNSGVLLTRVVFVKKSGKKTFYIVDAGMGDLIRPALYDAYHRIAPVQGPQKPVQRVDVVGPICESADFFAKGRMLPKAKRGDLLVLFSCGAYASVMGSTYNSRPLAPEVVTRGVRFQVARRRQSVQDLVRLERILP